MEKQELQAVVAGHICFDVIPAFRNTDGTNFNELLKPGRLIDLGSVSVSSGGPVSNTGIALKTLGIQTKLMGKIGKDYFGAGILDLLKKRELDGGMIVMDDEETSYTIVLTPPGSDRILLHHTGANDTFHADDINYDIVKNTKLFHFGYPPLMKCMFMNGGEELIKLFSHLKELGITTSLDMSLPDPSSESGHVDWAGMLERLLPFVDIFIPSVEEIMFMIRRDLFDQLGKAMDERDPLENLDMNSLPDMSDKLISMGAKMVVLKCGVRGYYIRTQPKEALKKMGRATPANVANWGDRELIEESFHIDNPASAAGSGDNSIAGFLAAFLNGENIEKSIKIACAVGGQNLRVYDAVSGVKSWNETLSMISGWDKNKYDLNSNYWRYDKRNENWIGKSDKGGRSL